MNFGSPHMLWLLLILLPALLAFFWWASTKRRQLIEQFIQARLLSALTSGISSRRRKLRFSLFFLAVAALVMALARPQWGFSWQEVKQRGVDIVVAIDCSRSMLAQDIAPNRLTRAKLAALELMQRARTDRLGLVAFAGSAFLACPLTIDDAAFSQSVDSLSPNSISQGGTAIADAIEAALGAFKEEENYKVLVLMTDGEDHDSGALEAARKAAAAGLRIYTIGIGTPKGELIRITDSQGKTDYVRDAQGNVVQSHLNEELLKTIAGAGEGGFYLPLRGAKTIETLYEEGLSKGPKSEHQEKLVKQYHERYHWPLGAAILLLIAEMLLPERRREARVRSAAQRAVSRAAAAATMVAVLMILPSAFAASPATALRDYKDGKYDQALKQYEQLLEKKSDDPRLHFNAGAAAYRNGKFDEARKQFDEAANSPDLNLQQRAYYNRGNSLYWLGEQAPDPQARTENWEKALQDYDLSLKLNSQDADARHNQEFVKRRLEELKKEQQQQNKNSKQDKQQDQNQNQQSDQSKQGQDQQQNQSQQNQAEQQQQDSSKQQQQQQQAQQQQQQQKQQPTQAEDQKEQSRSKQQQQKEQQQQAQAAEERKKEAQQEKEAAAAHEMTPRQAEQVLDAQKGKEKMLSFQQQGKPSDRNQPIKDW
jgi:Ca-activated chloride channel family protein